MNEHDLLVSAIAEVRKLQNIQLMLFNVLTFIDGTSPCAGYSGIYSTDSIYTVIKVKEDTKKSITSSLKEISWKMS